jgi:hypothetical protein
MINHFVDDMMIFFSYAIFWMEQLKLFKIMTELNHGEHGEHGDPSFQ